MQDLVGVRVADAAEEAGVRQGPLEGVILPHQDGLEGGKISLQHLQATGIVIAEGGCIPDDMERGALLGPCLGQQQAS